MEQVEKLSPAATEVEDRLAPAEDRDVLTLAFAHVLLRAAKDIFERPVLARVTVAVGAGVPEHDPSGGVVHSPERGSLHGGDRVALGLEER